MTTAPRTAVNLKVLLPLVAIVLGAGIWALFHRTHPTQSVSEFGQYQGYSEPIYDGTQRTSEYLALSDGTRLAYDLIIPTRKGALPDQPLPVLFKYTPYGRAWTVFDNNGKFVAGPVMNAGWMGEVMARIRLLVMGPRGRLMDTLARDGWLRNVVTHGYIVFAVDRPGTGASFSSPTPGSMETGMRFENEILDWIAAQPWSDGNIGMYGDSQNAVLQLAAAAAGNPHLKAILPAAPWIEVYEAVQYPGGIFDKGFATPYDAVVPKLDLLATPVDSDPDGSLLAQALQGHASRRSTSMALQNPYHDSITNGVSTWSAQDLYPFIERINRSGTPIYLCVGWYDIFTADAFYWYKNLTVAKRLTVRPTDHSQVTADLSDLSYSNEALRWFDYWLKGIQNGIMDEPPIHYYLQEGPKSGTWKTSEAWPLPSERATAYYFSQDKSGSVDSVNDGGLSVVPPTFESASDQYTVDYTITTGSRARWGAFDEAHTYPDMRFHDTRALTYTSAPLRTSLALTGHPVVHLWLSTGAPDLDVFTYLEQVASNGSSTYITEGNLRATHRKLGSAPFDNLGLPYQTHDQGDLEPVPSGQPFEMVFSLLPTSYEFDAGSRVRVTVAFADAGNFDTPVISPAPVLHLYRESTHASYIELPVLGTP